MNSFFMKNFFKNSLLKQVYQCNINNNNCNIGSQVSYKNFPTSAILRTSYLSKLQNGVLISYAKNFHTFPILHDEKQIKVADSGQKIGLADELLAATLKADSPPVEDEEARKQKEEERERTNRALKFTYIAVGGLMLAFAGFTIWTYGVPHYDEKGKLIEDEFSSMPTLQQYMYRTFKELKSMNRMIQEPSSDKLLPDSLSAPYFQPPYTLVLELTDLLVHPEWTYQSGWRFKKRPGVDFLLQHCAPPLFEVVIYTNEQAFTAHPVVEQLDTNNVIWYRIYKDGTRYENGKHYKDLYCLNRDLNKVIAIDWDKEASMSPRNTLNIKRWKGDMNDNVLIDLAVMLKTIAESDVGDVREVLAYYNTFDDPITQFKENNRLALEREQEVQNDKKSQRSFLRHLVTLKK